MNALESSDSKCDCLSCENPNEHGWVILMWLSAEKKRCDTGVGYTGEGKLFAMWPIYDCGKEGCEACAYNATLKPKHDLTWEHYRKS